MLLNPFELHSPQTLTEARKLHRQLKDAKIQILDVVAQEVKMEISDLDIMEKEVLNLKTNSVLNEL